MNKRKRSDSEVSLDRSEIPLYLQNSEFYRNLDKRDDYHSYVPTKCYKKTVQLDSLEDLEHLLSTMRFWRLRYIPAELMAFVLDPAKDGVTDICEKFHDELDYLWYLCRIRSESKESAKWEFAVSSEEMDIVRYLHASGLQWNTVFFNAAALDRNVEMMRFAHLNGCPWNQYVCAHAARSGSFECLKYAHENGAPWEKTHIPGCFYTEQGGLTCSNAAGAGSLQCLKYARAKGCWWNEDTCTRAAQGGHLECLRYAFKKGCRFSLESCIAAAKKGHTECLLFLHKHSCDKEDCGLFTQPEAAGVSMCEWYLKHHVDKHSKPAGNEGLDDDEGGDY